MKIDLENGKYSIQNDNGILTFYRYGEFWPGSEDLQGAGVVLALVHEVERLREILGSLDYRFDA